MKELIEVAQTAISKYVESGEIEKTIATHVEKAFNEAISSAFRWGSLEKSIKEVVETKLSIAVKDIDLQSYNAIMLEALKGQITNFTNEKALSGFTELLSETFGEAPKEISINEIVNKILDSWREDDPCACNDKKATLSLVVNKRYRTLGSSYSLEISDGEKYSSDKFSLYFLNDKLRISHKSELNPTSLGCVEGWLFKLYAAGTTVTGLDKFYADDFDLDLSFQQD